MGVKALSSICSEPKAEPVTVEVARSGAKDSVILAATASAETCGNCEDAASPDNHRATVGAMASARACGERSPKAGLKWLIQFCTTGSRSATNCREIASGNAFASGAIAIREGAISASRLPLLSCSAAESTLEAAASEVMGCSAAASEMMGCSTAVVTHSLIALATASASSLDVAFKSTGVAPFCGKS